LPLKTEKGQSSSFVIDLNEQQWLVTARHIFDELDNDAKFTVLDNAGVTYSSVDMERLYLPNPVIDIAIFRLGVQIPNLEPTFEVRILDDVFVTQGAYIVGYPKLSNGLSVSYKSPLVKRAMVSGQVDHYGVQVWVLDGMNNKGFSGGPVILSEGKEDCRVLGAVSSYVPEDIPVTPESNGYVSTNAGLMVCFDISHAVDAIDGI
jgi:hypothetical protein